MADASTAAVLAVLGSMLFDWVEAPGNRRNGIALAFACGCVTLVDLRQASMALFGLLIVGCAVAAWRYRGRLGAAPLRSLGIVMLPPLLVLLLWGHYAKTQIPGGDFPILAISAWHWAEFPQTLHHILTIMLAKVGLFGLIVFIGIRAALALRRTDDLGPAAGSVVIVSAAVCIGSIFFLTFTYLAAGFSPEEAAAAASFWRYMGEVGSLATLGAVAGLPLGWLRRVPLRPAMAALVAIAVVLPVATVKFYRSDLDSQVPRLRQMAATMEATVPRSASLELIDPTGNGFPLLVVYYDLVLSGHDRGLPPRAVSRLSRVNGLSAADLAQPRDDAAQWVWLAEGAPDVAGQRLNPACSYLLKRDGAGFSVAAGWDIGPLTRGRRGDAGSGSVDAACR
jgi:hypothetical protein